MFISAAHNGPFSKVAYSPTATYPCLWSHSAKKETRIQCEPDSQLQVKQGMETRAAELWATASYSHISRGFRFNSQPLAIAVTRDKTHRWSCLAQCGFSGTVALTHALAVWGNSTLGFLLLLVAFQLSGGWTWGHDDQCCRVSPRPGLPRLERRVSLPPPRTFSTTSGTGS